ncbi:MAG: TIGR02266 family protein [Deltaproteobacteria bacterium]|nr:TIGR02266 family protein [Deltaproteobacteria bacterium]
MSETNTRQAKRTPVTLKIKFKSETLDQFIERYSVDISGGGIFIRTKDPLTVGTTLRFEFQLKDASPLITGDGTVVWTREHDPSRVGVAPGMGVRFDRLTPKSKEVLDKILSEKANKNPGQKGSFEQGGPTRVAPQPVIADLAESSRRSGSFGDDGSDSTPLPKPVPFHTDAEDFPADAFSQATKVTDLDDLVEATKEAEAVLDDAPTRVADKQVIAKARAKASEKASEKTKVQAPPPDKTMHGHAPAQQESSAEADEIAQARAEKERKKREAHARKVKTVIEAAQDPRKQAVKQRLLSKQMALASAAGDEMAAEALAEEAAAIQPGRSSGSGLWIAAGVVMLLVAVGGGYMYLNRGGDEAEGGKNVIGVKDGTQATDEVEERPNFPGIGEGPLVAIVDSKPTGADVELLDHDAVGPVPMKFEGLADGKKYRAKVTLPGYLDKIVTIKGGDEAKLEPIVAKLEPKPRRLSLKSSPPGATIVINEEELGKTPKDLVLKGKLATQDDISIQLRLDGYVPIYLPVNVSNNFEDKGTEMALAIEEKLQKEMLATAGATVRPERRTVPVRRVRPRRRTGGTEGGETKTPTPPKPAAKPKDLGEADPTPEFLK